jgi:hypothetical protein
MTDTIAANKGVHLGQYIVVEIESWICLNR